MNTCKCYNFHYHCSPFFDLFMLSYAAPQIVSWVSNYFRVFHFSFFVLQKQMGVLWSVTLVHKWRERDSLPNPPPFPLETHLPPRIWCCLLRNSASPLSSPSWLYKSSFCPPGISPPPLFFTDLAVANFPGEGKATKDEQWWAEPMDRDMNRSEWFVANNWRRWMYEDIN